MEEIWVPVKGKEGLYDVSNLGRVRSHDTIQRRSNGRVMCDFHVKGRILAPRYTGRDASIGQGYATVLIGGKNVKVHRLVAEAFLENPNGYTQVNHIDGNKRNNAAGNLEWCDGSHNIQHSLTKELRPTGERVKNHKLTAEQAHEIRKRYKKGSSVNGVNPLAREYGVAKTTIDRIVKREKWRWD